MQYFTKKLWGEMNSENPDLRIQAEHHWKENCKKYHDYFKQILPVLPKTLRLFSELKLHDSIIEKIIFDFSAKKCSFVLSAQAAQYFIEFENVFDISINMRDSCYWICGNLQWSYSEIEVISKSCYRISILFDPENEVSFSFTSITYCIK